MTIVYEHIIIAPEEYLAEYFMKKSPEDELYGQEDDDKNENNHMLTVTKEPMENERYQNLNVSTVTTIEKSQDKNNDEDG